MDTKFNNGIILQWLYSTSNNGLNYYPISLETLYCITTASKPNNIDGDARWHAVTVGVTNSSVNSWWAEGGSGSMWYLILGC